MVDHCFDLRDVSQAALLTRSLQRGGFGVDVSLGPIVPSKLPDLRLAESEFKEHRAAAHAAPLVFVTVVGRDLAELRIEAE